MLGLVVPEQGGEEPGRAGRHGQAEAGAERPGHGRPERAGRGSAPPPAGLGEAWPGAPAPRDGGPRAAGAGPGMAAAAARGEPGPRCCRFARGENALINNNNAHFFPFRASRLSMRLR